MKSKKIGILTVYSGCMFSGKTDNLIKKILELKKKNQKILVFKPKICNRDKNIDILRSRTNKFCDAINVLVWKDIKYILEKKNYKIDAIAIDETQFFNKELINYINEILDIGIDVFIAGLDRGFSDNNLDIMNKIFSFADVIFKFNTICKKCKKNFANKTQRINIEGIAIRKTIIKNKKDFVGGKNLYEPRCRKCFVKFL